MKCDVLHFTLSDGRIVYFPMVSSLSYIPPQRWETYQKFASKGDRKKYTNIFGNVKEMKTCYTEDMYISDVDERLGEYEYAMTRSELLKLLKDNGTDMSQIMFDKDGYLCTTHAVCIVDVTGKKYHQYFKTKSAALKTLQACAEKFEFTLARVEIQRDNH